MKNLLTLFVAFFFFCSHASSLSIKEAMANKQIAVDVSGTNYDSVPQYLRAAGEAPGMQMTVSNLTDRTLDLDLDPGYMLEPVEHGYQAMLLTQYIKLKVNPGARQRNYIHAMCTQLHNSGPNSTLHYHVANIAPPALLQMAMFIAQHDYQSFSAQEAVWSISDGMPTPTIGNYNIPMDNELQNLVANIKGEDIGKLRKEFKANQKAVMSEFIGSRADRNIPFDISDSAMVTVGYYSHDGVLLKPIITETLFKNGKHSIRYDPYPVAYSGQHYMVKMIKNGSVYREYYFSQ